MPEPTPRRGSPRLRAVLKDLHHQTWELELLISGLVAFALLQLPGPLGQWQRAVMVQVGEIPSLVLILMLAFVKLALYALLVAFGFHLVVRAFWVGLVGLDSVFPRGVRPERLTLGPEAASLARNLPTVRQLIVRTDALASVVFAGAFALVVICVMAIPSYGGILALGFGAAALLPGEETVQQVFWAVWTTFMVVTLIPTLLDRTVAHRLPPTSWTRRGIRGILKTFQAISGYRIYGPVQATLSSHLGNRVVSVGAILVFVLLTGFYIVNDALLLTGRGTFVGSPFLPSQAGAAFLDPSYYDEIRDPRRGRLDLPSIPARVSEDGFLPLFIPYRPVSMDDAIREACPHLVSLGRVGLRTVPTPRDDDKTRERNARARAALACAEQLWQVTLNGAPVTVRPQFTRHAQTRNFGLLYMIPMTGLPVGRHELVVARVEPAGEESPAVDGPPGAAEDDGVGARRFVIPFWRAPREG